MRISHQVSLLRLSLILAACLSLIALVAPRAQADFGFASAEMELNNPDGTPARQAGSHPNFVVRLRFNELSNSLGEVVPDESIRDFHVDLPPGFVGNPTVAPTCEQNELRPLTGITSEIHCPVASQIGFVRVLNAPHELFNEETFIRTGVFNMVHGPEVAATFGFIFGGVLTQIVPSVNPGQYEIITDTTKISQAEPIFGFEVELWGVPADPSHDADRQGIQHPDNPGEETVLGAPSPDRPRPFFSLPTSCDGQPATVTFTADSWQHHERPVSESFSADPAGVPFITQGCDHLGFAPNVSVQPTSHVAAEPTGLQVDLSVPQNQSPTGLSTPDVRRTSVRLPQGMTISPSAAPGSGGCALDQIKLDSNEAPTCPDSSKIGSVVIDTPLLSEPLEGDLILAKQDENPFSSLLALYIAVKGPNFYLKFPGKVEPDPVTGQLTATFDNTPQLPFSNLHLDIGGGANAVLTDPVACGTYYAHTEVTSWASDVPKSFDSPIAIDQGCGTGGFSPVMHLAATDPESGEASPLVVEVSRNDGEQNVSGINVTLPKGEIAKLAGVPLCGDAQALAGTCAADSQIGKLSAEIGAGPYPLAIPEAGKEPTGIYLAGPYKGAPYSLVFKVPAQAGPFDLGTVAVRAGIYIDPTTAQVTVRSDALPQILQGIPVAYRDIRVEVTRPNFTINPTNCNQTSVTSVITSDQGATANPSARFQVGDCANLVFTPKLTASTTAKSSRAAGASLSVKLAYPAKSAAQANVASVKVDLPKQLPSRLTTLQKACTAAVFAANPASCPAASVVGHATVSTPLLAAPLSGPTYFVSHGGEAFPSLTIVLQGNGVTVQLVGSTFISKAGITSTTFKTVPDVPFSTFALTLPQGKYSALAANGNLCKSKLALLTAFTAQNGAQIKQTAPISVAGCAKAKKATKPSTKKKAKRSRDRSRAA
jgi:hypothetical protein